MVQSLDILPLPTLEASCGEPTCYLGKALKQALHASIAFLTSIHELQAAHSHSNILLRAAPEGAYILSHAKKDNSTHDINFVVSIEDPSAYTMLANQNDPIRTTINTTTTGRGKTWQQITPINIIAYNKSILGRNY